MADRAAPQFTPRLKEVSAHIVNGATDAQIARALGISVDGVRTHVNRVLELTGSPNRTQAAVRVVLDGIVSAPVGTGLAVVEVQDLTVLMGALRRAEMYCQAIEGVAAKFEAAYPQVGATPPPPGATLVRNSDPTFPHSVVRRPRDCDR